MRSTGGGKDRVGRILDEWARERPDLDVSPLGVIGRLHRLGDFLRDELVGVVRSFGINEGEFEVLLALRRAGAPYERNPGQLAEFTMVTSGAMTKRLDSLEAAGLVTRRVSDKDGRGRLVALTPQGFELAERAFEAHMENEHRVMQDLSASDAAELERLLTLWLARYDRLG